MEHQEREQQPSLATVKQLLAGFAGDFDSQATAQMNPGGHFHDGVKLPIGLGEGDGSRPVAVRPEPGRPICDPGRSG